MIFSNDDIANLACWQSDDIHLLPNHFTWQILTQDNQKVSAKLILHFACANLHAAIAHELQLLFAERFPAATLELQIVTEIPQHQVQHGLSPRKGIKNIFVVASGKGGVGKSSTAVNLALALQSEGARVGLLDADIYGPSEAMMLGVTAAPESQDGKTLEPLLRYGLQTMSMAYLIDQDTAMIWRGPMVSTALQQLFNDTQWHDLDYLVIDLPPGTGDVQLTLSQKIPVAGALIVSTPQDVALLDAKKAVAMFSKVNIPILGLIENMAGFICSCCGHQEAIFGEGGAMQMAQEYHLSLLGHIPLSKQIREDLDQGRPTVMAYPEHPISKIYAQIARRLSAALAIYAKQTISKFPRIVVE